MSNLKKIRVQHVDRNAEGIEVKTDVDVLTDADCITMDDGDLRSGVKKMIDDRIGEVIDGAPKELDTLKEIAEELAKNQSGVSTILKKMNNKIDKSQISNNHFDNSNEHVPSCEVFSEYTEYIKNNINSLNQGLNDKVSKEEGKGLSTNDFTDEDKNKLDGIDLSNYVTDEKFTSITGEALAKANEALEKSMVNEDYIKTVDAKAEQAMANAQEAYQGVITNSQKIDVLKASIEELSIKEVEELCDEIFK